MILADYLIVVLVWGIKKASEKLDLVFKLYFRFIEWVDKFSIDWPRIRPIIHQVEAFLVGDQEKCWDINCDFIWFALVLWQVLFRVEARVHILHEAERIYSDEFLWLIRHNIRYDKNVVGWVVSFVL